MKDYLKLTYKERLQYSFQLKILEALYPNEASYYGNLRKAIEEGYTLNYSDISGFISEEELSINNCREVLDILDMYRSIIFSYIKLVNEKKNVNLTKDNVKFPGFDGNEETKLLLYTTYYLDDLNRYSEIKEFSNGYYNSHTQMIDKYRKMLSCWKQKNKKIMTEEEILSLLNC